MYILGVKTGVSGLLVGFDDDSGVRPTLSSALNVTSSEEVGIDWLIHDVTSSEVGNDWLRENTDDSGVFSRVLSRLLSDDVDAESDGRHAKLSSALPW